jgi:DNA-binding NtrC family response regulator
VIFDMSVTVRALDGLLGGISQLAPEPGVNLPTTGEYPAALEVLVVDDEPLIRWSLRRGLTRRGHQVVEAGSRADAIRQLESDPARFDVVVLDYRLPDEQTLALLREIRQMAPASAIFMMTAYGDALMREQALALGARIVIDKPFQVNEVVSLVESPPPMHVFPDA